MIGEIIANFHGQDKVTDAEIAEYCNANNITPISSDELEDYRYQVEHDARYLACFKDIMIDVLPEIKLENMFMNEEQKKEMNAHNDALSGEVVKIMEKHGVNYGEHNVLLPNLRKEIDTVLTNAGTIADNGAQQAFMSLTRKHAGIEGLAIPLNVIFDYIKDEAKAKHDAMVAEQEGGDEKDSE